jgi:hypothetical protein
MRTRADRVRTGAASGTPVLDVDEDVTGISSTTAPVITAGPGVG